MLDFFLQNNKTLKTAYFTSLFYYEPYVTDFQVNLSRDEPDILDYHVFHAYFPKRKVFFYPKMIILQSVEPCFSFQKSFLEFYHAVVLKPYLTCTKPLNFKNTGHAPKGLSKEMSVVKHKEFFLSFLFASKMNLSAPIIKQLKFADRAFEIGMVYYEKHFIEKSNYRLLTRLFEDRANARKFITLYFHLLLERKAVIVHERPSEFMQILLSVLRPL